MDRIKSIAVPVTRRGAITKARRTRQPASQGDSDVDLALVEFRRPQPTAARPVHCYSVGQRLALGRGSVHFVRQVAACKVVALVPHETGPLRYRVQSEIENFERIVDEADLAPLP